MLESYKKRIQAQSLTGELDIEAELYYVRRLKAAAICPQLLETYEDFIKFLANFTGNYATIKNEKIFLN